MLRQSDHLTERLRCKKLEDKIMSAEDAAWLIKEGMTVAVSGFTPSGNPKAVPLAISRQVREGERTLHINLLSGASTGKEIDNDFAELGIILHRYPYTTSKAFRNEVNGKLEHRNVAYMDQHLGMMAQNTRYGFYGKIDYAIIEAVAIREDGGIIPTTAVGCSQTYLDLAEKVILEINLTQSVGFEGIHDIYTIQDPPHRPPIELTYPGQRIGRTYLNCEPDKIAAVVISECHENPRPLAKPDKTSCAIAGHIVDFLKKEAASGGISPDQVPLQSGVGSVANAVLSGLVDSDFHNLSLYSEVIQDGVLDLIDSGKAIFASGTSLSLSEDGMRRLMEHFDNYKDKLILRDSEISNHAEVIRRLGVIAMNTAIEADIYGNINSSHMNGTDIYNGIGGSGDYARNASITIFLTNSTAKDGRISSIVPMVTHVDHPEHDVDVIVTEQGYADLRGKSPKERAALIIEDCAHPDYRPQLRKYFHDACEACNYSQTPHMLDRCFSFHLRLKETGSMLERKML